MEKIRSVLSSTPQQKEKRAFYSSHLSTGGKGRNEVEMKLTEDEAPETLIMTDEVDLIVQKPQNKKKALMFLVITMVLLLVIAFLLGYITFRNTCRTCPADTVECMAVVNDFDDSWQDTEEIPQSILHWTDLKTMLNKYIDKAKIIENIRMISERPHPAGSTELHQLNEVILNQFHSCSLNHVWTDSHYVTLPFPDSSSPNYLWLMDPDGGIQEKFGPLDQDVFLAYSPTGNVTGGLVYGNYGRQEDFRKLNQLGIKVQDNIVLIRIGKISFAEKVAAAQEHGAIGVLLYPDPADIPQMPRGSGPPGTTAISGHVHLGTGDPFTPGFPSFNHTQFPPVESSALPNIPALTISANIAFNLISKMEGPLAPPAWKGGFPYFIKYVLGPKFSKPGVQLQMNVASRMVSTMIYNIFGSIEGFLEPDRYIILGAQRDAWGPGAAKSGVGTAILLELAHALSEMVVNGFRPRRSLLFASWDAGEYGSIGATEWLEGYLTMMHLKAVAYFSLDRAVLGDDTPVAQSSPLLHQLIEKVMKQVESPNQGAQNLYKQITARFPNFKEEIIQPLTMESSAYPFTAFAGVPAMELNFREADQVYPFLNTKLDTFNTLNRKLNSRLGDFSEALAQVVGQMAIKLSHNELLPLNYRSYSEVILKYLMQLHTLSEELESRGLTLQWLFSARGDFVRAAQRLTNLIQSSDEKDERLTRIYNNKIMRVEFYFLSQYVSATDTPFRHILHGRGNHTLEALTRHFHLLQSEPSRFDEQLFRRQLALVTWTLQGAANALSGDVWSLTNNNF
ncbi:transferrin receptor protein 2 [Pristis pectinata]|uniref:transferrin receptor protein 2 n=1 Tax=Pristis pectinata TaxID=685728 RepID=UPI00223DA4EE|nr:transferrin receptor protein 2 [Pristis pectinata]